MIAEAWLIVLGGTGVLLFLAGLLHIPITAVTAAVCIVIAAGAGYAATRRAERDLGRRIAPAAGRSRHVALVLTLLPAAVVLYAALFIPLRDFDGRAFWLLKAKGIAHDHAIDGAFFHDQQVTDPRNDYPLLLPLDGAAILLLGNTFDDTAVRWLHLLTFLAFVFFIRARLGPWPAALLAWIPQFATAGEGGALSAYNDIPLAAFIAAAFIELQEARGGRPDGETRSSGQTGSSLLHSWRFGMWLAFAVLTKNEGLPLALILLVAGAWVLRGRIAAALLPFGVAVLSLFLWKQRIPHGADEDLAALLPTLPHQLHRIPGAVTGLASHLVAAPWGLFWVAAFAAVIWRAWRQRDLLPAFVITAALIVYIAVYAVTTWVQIDLINSSADRLLMHLAGPALGTMFGRRQKAEGRRQRAEGRRQRAEG